MSKKDKRDNRDAGSGPQFVALCKTFSTPVAYSTMLSLLKGPRSVADICLENKTPPSSTYKTIKGLQQVGLASVQDIIIDEQGKRVTLYRSKVKSLSINLDKNGSEIMYETLDKKENPEEDQDDSHASQVGEASSAILSL